ncbi:hypothetical protein E2542_SST25458 [Spatholobus suberectus]|nr:hypothetical protein E2542_SST25458 [Spatholobus suberectus]
MAMASPSSRTQTSPRSCSSAFASTSATNFSPRTYSGANVRVHGHRPSPSSLARFFSGEQRAESPGGRSMTVKSKSPRSNDAVSSKLREKRSCMCSPTTHPGSFRCAYHKQLAERQKQKTTSLSDRKLNLLRSAMKNSVVRIGGVEGELVRRALTTLIRPSSHHLRRREAFQPRPTRLSLMSKAQDG